MTGVLTFIPPTEEHAQILLDWRTRPDIADQMLSEVPYDVERQKAWLRRCEQRDDYTHRILCVDGVPAGHVSITITEPIWKIATIGVLMGERVGRVGAAPLNFAYMLNHVFFTLGLRKVVNHILASNSPRLLKGQPLLGYRPVGVLTRHVVKDGREIDLHVFEMLADDWLAVRSRFGVFQDMDGREWR